MDTKQITTNRIDKFLEHTPASQSNSDQITANRPRYAQTTYVRLFSKNINLKQLKEFLDLYDDEND